MRTLKTYQELLGKPFLDEVAKLSSVDHVIDLGAGDGIASKDLAQGTMQIAGTSIKNPRVTGISAASKFFESSKNEKLNMFFLLSARA